MESLELGRNLKRNCENMVSKKRLALVVIAGLVIIIYLLPRILEWYRVPKNTPNVIDVCLRDRLSSFYTDLKEFNAGVGYLPETESPNLIGYIGNGYIGLDAINDDQLYIRSGRLLTLPTSIYPVIVFKNDIGHFRSAYVVDYKTGIVHLFQCYESGFYASFQYYTHRKSVNLFVQEVKLSNPNDHNVDVTFEARPINSLSDMVTRTLNGQEYGNMAFNVTSGYLDSSNDEQFIPFSIFHLVKPVVYQVAARSSKSLSLYAGYYYGKRRKVTDRYNTSWRQEAEKTVTDVVRKAINEQGHLKATHISSWHNLWTPGFVIEPSKAKNALNGDKINATMYYVLSHVKDGVDVSEVSSPLTYLEGCYGNHHTLEATNLWGSVDSVREINRVVYYWLLTLEKNGCHKMVQTGAKGVAEAMILSFGGLRFSNQHLEFNIDPKYLHRGCLFHRLSYGNKTHVNISVVVQEDNKAVLQVALDRSDKNYYACDAGCLDPPIVLGPQPVTFPVKLTEPLTPILYITYDKLHMEELRKAIHVREIGEAPAHEHHVIALHKHGHHLGGLPTFFWVSVSVLILIFHLFLFKLIYNEYCASNNFDRQRFRYGKL